MALMKVGEKPDALDALLVETRKAVIPPQKNNLLNYFEKKIN